MDTFEKEKKNDFFGYMIYYDYICSIEIQYS